MANTINTIKDASGIIAKMAAQMLADELQFVKSISKAPESDYEGKNGYKSGDTIYVSKPARFTASTSADITSSIQDIVEEKVPLVLDTRSVVPVSLTSKDIATEMGMKEWAKRILKPAMATIAQDVESRFLEKAVDATYNLSGTAGSTTFNTATMLDAKSRMDKMLCPKMGNERYALLSSNAEVSAVNARNGLFNDTAEVSKLYRSGAMGRADGFTYLSNQLLPTHTNGNDVTGVNVNGASQTGATLSVQGLTTTTGTVTKGSVFTIAGVYRVHPQTKAVTSELQQFVVTADVTADGSGNADLSISPSIVTTGSLQTVSASPADTAAMTFVGAASTGYTQNLAFHKDAFRMVSVPLIMPDGVHMASQSTVDGLTVRALQDFDVRTDELIFRLDFLGGLVATRPEWAARITE